MAKKTDKSTVPLVITDINHVGASVTLEGFKDTVKIIMILDYEPDEIKGNLDHDFYSAKVGANIPITFDWAKATLAPKVRKVNPNPKTGKAKAAKMVPFPTVDCPGSGTHVLRKDIHTLKGRKKARCTFCGKYITVNKASSTLRKHV